jgi:hypothetical protein
LVRIDLAEHEAAIATANRRMARAIAAQPRDSQDELIAAARELGQAWKNAQEDVLAAWNESQRQTNDFLEEVRRRLIDAGMGDGKP